MRINEEKLTEIAQANDIIDVISSYTKMKKSGRSFIALCPFHPDKNPSMSVSQEKQVYHCFSCGASGNIFKFVQDHEKITFLEAVQKLADRAAIELDFKKDSPDLSNEISMLYEVNKVAAHFFHDNLKNTSGAEREFVYDYLYSRGLKDYTVRKFGIGYASKEWDTLLEYFKDHKDFKREDFESAGLIKKSDKGDGSYYDRFRGRLIFPVFNESGKVVAFGGRKLYGEDPSAKYINSPETKIYNKSKILYGLNFAKDAIRAKDFVILVEGYMDVIALNQSDIQNVVASSGTALTEEQVRLISRYTKNIIMLFDGDYAGIKAAKRGIEIILEGGLELTIVSLPENEDPDSFIRTKGKDEFEKLINGKKNFVDFIASLYTVENKLDSVNDKTEFIKEIIGFIGKIPFKIKQSFYIKELASEYGLYESDLMDELRTVMKKNTLPVKSGSMAKVQRPASNGSRKKSSDLTEDEKELIEIFINANEEIIGYLENHLETAFIKSPLVLKITEAFLDEFMNEGKIDVSKIINRLNDEKLTKIITEAATQKYCISEVVMKEKHSILGDPKSAKKDYSKLAYDLIKNMKRNHLEEKALELIQDRSKIDEYILIKKEINKLINSK